MAIGKGGIVKSEAERKRAIDKVTLFAESVGFRHIKTIRSPIEGGDGNIEYLAHFKKEAVLEKSYYNSERNEG